MTPKDWVAVIAAAISFLFTVGGLVWFLATTISKIRNDMGSRIESLKGEVGVSIAELKGHLDSQDLMLTTISEQIAYNAEGNEKTADGSKDLDRRITIIETTCEMRHEREDPCKS